MFWFRGRLASGGSKLGWPLEALGPEPFESGLEGMYNVKYDHGYATGAKGSYDRQLSYAYAKRGQARHGLSVSLCQSLPGSSNGVLEQATERHLVACEA